MASKTPAPYMTLAAANFFLKYAKARGVSKVARGESKSAVTKIGFMQAYAKAKGNHKKLQTMMATPRQTWDERRNNFVARHMAQVTKRGEALYETSGKYKGWPTRRHLGLIMWAMTPDPRGVGNLIARERGLKTRTTRANGLSSRRTSARAGKGKGIRIPSEWISLVSQALDALEKAIPSYTARHGLDEPRADGFVNLPLDAPGLSPRVRELLTDRPNTALRVEIMLFASTPAMFGEDGALASYWPAKNTLIFVVGQTDPAYIRHELVHALQTNANWYLVDTGRVRGQAKGGPKSAVGQRRAYWRRGQPAHGQPSTATEFEAYIEQLAEEVERIVNAHYEMVISYYVDPAWDGEILPHREHLGSVNAQIRDYATAVGGYFEDPRARRDAMRRIANRGAEQVDTNEAMLRTFLARIRETRRILRTVANRKVSAVPRANGLSKRRRAARASTGRGIRIPQAWIDEILDLTGPQGALGRAVAAASVRPCVRCRALSPIDGKFCPQCGAPQPAPLALDSAVRSARLRLRLDAAGLSPKLRELLGAYDPYALNVTVQLYPGLIGHPVVGTARGTYSPSLHTVSIAGGLPARDREVVIRHELVHMVQYMATDMARLTGRVKTSMQAPVVGVRRGYMVRAKTHAPSTAVEFEAYLSEYIAKVERHVDHMYAGFAEETRVFGEHVPSEERVRDANAVVRSYIARGVGGPIAPEDRAYLAKFTDPRSRRDAEKRVVDAGARRIAELEATVGAELDAEVRQQVRARAVANPRYTSARRDDPELWERVKAAVTRGTKGGKAGQWSARKAQFAVAEYQRRGGGYIGPKSPRNALAKWTREEWGTKSGRASLKTGERYLPKAAREALTPAEYAETTRAKRAGLRRGEQFTRQPKRIARKTAKYRK